MSAARHRDYDEHAFAGALKITAIMIAVVVTLILAWNIFLPPDAWARIARELSPAYAPTDDPTGLHLAAIQNDVAEIRKLAAAGANPNEQVDWVEGVPRQGSPMHAAAEAGSAEAIRALYAVGGSVTRSTGQGDPPLSVASNDVLPLLVQLGADPNQGDSFGIPPHFYAAFHWHHTGDRSRFDLLISLGADLTKRDSSGSTVLGYIADFPDTSATQAELVEMGAVR